jgi:hypothetical protein
VVVATFPAPGALDAAIAVVIARIPALDLDAAIAVVVAGAPAASALAAAGASAAMAAAAAAGAPTDGQRHLVG